MSRELPARPNLEYLRKQAKDLLPALQARTFGAQLADAQHVLAREYGFASWPKLKSHVESRSAAVPEQSSPFHGRWRADLSRSRRHPANEFRSALLEFDVAGAAVEIRDVVIDESGREEQRLSTIHADGAEHPAGTGNGYSVIATWRGLNVLETVARKDGVIVGVGTYEVSADGNTLTVSGDQLRIVFDRIERHRGGPHD